MDARCLELHPVTAIFPDMTDEQQERLTESIRLHGLAQPIVLWRGKIIDGRNRWICGLNAGLAWEDRHFREWDGEEDQLHDYVWELNGNDCRRHLDKSALAAIAADIKKGKQAVLAASVSEKRSEAGKQGGRGHRKQNGTNTVLLCMDGEADATKAVAAQVGVSPTYVQLAERIQEKSPEVFAEVKQGRKTVTKAAKELGIRKSANANRHNKHGLPPGTHAVPLIDNPSAGGKVATKTIYVPEEPTRLEDVVADHEERAAIREDVSDQVWVEGLQPYRKLQGRLRDDFAMAAVAARHFWSDGGRDALKSEMAKLPGNRKTPPYFFYFRLGLENLPPDQWYACPPMTEGGCDGAGSVEFMGERSECSECRGAGYRIRA